jgi:hypothetical protein
LKLAGNDGFHFAPHGRLVTTAAIVTRLLSSDTITPAAIATGKTTPAITADKTGNTPHLPPYYIHPTYKRTKTTFVAHILPTLKLAGNNGLHFAPHGRLVTTAAIMTRLLSSDTSNMSNPTEQQRLLHITMPHLKSSLTVPPSTTTQVNTLTSSTTQLDTIYYTTNNNLTTNPNERPYRRHLHITTMHPKSSFTVSIVSPDIDINTLISSAIQLDSTIYYTTNNNLTTNPHERPHRRHLHITTMHPESSFTVSTVSPDIDEILINLKTLGKTQQITSRNQTKSRKKSRKNTALSSNNVIPIHENDCQ